MFLKNGMSKKSRRDLYRMEKKVGLEETTRYWVIGSSNSHFVSIMTTFSSGLETIVTEIITFTVLYDEIHTLTRSLFVTPPTYRTRNPNTDN